MLSSTRYGYRWRPTALASAPIGWNLGQSNAVRKLISCSECHAKRRENSEKWDKRLQEAPFASDTIFGKFGYANPQKRLSEPPWGRPSSRVMLFLSVTCQKRQQRGVLCDTISAKTILWLCFTAPCRQAPFIPMLDDRMSSSDQKWGA